MRTPLRGILAGVFVASAVFMPCQSAAGPNPVPGYVALGDSIEVGLGDDDLGDGFGYVGPFGAFLKAEVHNFGQAGAETRDIFHDQLFPAMGESQDHRPFGVVVSWGGGGNDLRHFIVSPEARTCLRVRSCLARLNALLDEMEQTIDLTLKGLRTAAGTESRILMRTQYNPLRRTACAPPEQVQLGDAALEGAEGTILTRGLNDRIRTVAARRGADVVELFTAFAADPDGLIAEDCVHPNGAGYDVILEAFKTTFGEP
jgi:lysophospholipase L1-like esterase